MCLVRRHGLWEQHGTLVPTVRVSDDFLEGGQNATVGHQCTHRLATLDTIADSLRAGAELFNEEIAQFASDFAQAFKQVPSVDSPLQLTVIGQLDPHHKYLPHRIPYSQTFDGRYTPLNFARYPAWCCWVLAVIAGRVLEHCVDDMIGAERKTTFMSGWDLWRKFANKSQTPNLHRHRRLTAMSTRCSGRGSC